MQRLEIRVYRESDEDNVVALWRQCGLVVPWNDPVKDIRRKLRMQPHLFLVGFSNGQLAATIMAGYEGHRGWINYLAVAPEYRRQGFGRLMMDEAETRLREMGVTSTPAAQRCSWSKPLTNSSSVRPSTEIASRITDGHRGGSSATTHRA